MVWLRERANVESHSVMDGVAKHRTLLCIIHIGRCGRREFSVIKRGRGGPNV